MPEAQNPFDVAEKLLPACRPLVGRCFSASPLDCANDRNEPPKTMALFTTHPKRVGAFHGGVDLAHVCAGSLLVASTAFFGACYDVVWGLEAAIVCQLDSIS